MRQTATQDTIDIYVAHQPFYSWNANRKGTYEISHFSSQSRHTRTPNWYKYILSQALSSCFNYRCIIHQQVTHSSQFHQQILLLSPNISINAHVQRTVNDSALEITSKEPMIWSRNVSQCCFYAYTSTESLAPIFLGTSRIAAVVRSRWMAATTNAQDIDLCHCELTNRHVTLPGNEACQVVAGSSVFKSQLSTK